MTNLNDNAMTAFSNTHAAQSIMEKSFHDGALDYLSNDSTYDALGSIITLLATAQATLESVLIGENVNLLV